VLRGLLKREIEIEPLDTPAARPRLVAPQSPNPSPKPSPKRKPRPVRIAFLYPEDRRVQADAQAAAILHEIQTYAEDCIGAYVPMRHIERFYKELATRRGWQVHDWSVIGCEFGRLTGKKLVKRAGRRYMCYRIPRPKI